MLCIYDIYDDAVRAVVLSFFVIVSIQSEVEGVRVKD